MSTTTPTNPLTLGLRLSEDLVEVIRHITCRADALIEENAAILLVHHTWKRFEDSQEATPNLLVGFFDTQENWQKETAASWKCLWPGTAPKPVELLGLGQIFAMCTCRSMYQRVIQAPGTKQLLATAPSQSSGYGRVDFPPEFHPSGTEPSIRPMEV